MAQLFVKTRVDKPLTLLFDLDETLAHCKDCLLNNADQVEVTIRPSTFKVLSELRLHFELGLFTSARKQYADLIVERFDPKDELFSFRLYKDSCVDADGVVYKDLSVLLPRLIETVFIVDNNMFCFGAHLS